MGKKERKRPIAHLSEPNGTNSYYSTSLKNKAKPPKNASV